ncbi:PH-interacting protein isoform X1 [Euwallacea fornicatus]|uniref:PH-interacting protein isoform X1 n=2 Tax=Euwallacea fornicatus TaxID=995702 RepID=UPI00338FE6DE
MELQNVRKMVNGVPETSPLASDVYFLIQRFLSKGPLRRTFQTLNEELHEHRILPKRIDWKGNEHDRTVEDMQRQYPNIREDFLFYLCSQASALLNPNTQSVPSFLCFRPNSKTKNGTFINSKQIFNYVNKYRGVSLQDIKAPFNIVNNIRGREIGGSLSRQRIIGPKIFTGMQIQRCTIGHLSAVYCLLFDHSGRYVITGADDLLIKLWSTYTGRLIATFRGASSEITDIAVDPENILLAAGSIDRILRVWNLQSGAPVAVLTGHTGMITSVNFCPTSCWGQRYLITTSTDGSIAFWVYSSDGKEKVDFRNTPTLYQEKLRPGQAQMICSSFSPGGTFLATGSADHHVRVYYMKGDEGPQRILETEAHTDRVDSIQWAHSGLRFLSGSKDGSAIVWWFERQQWKNLFLDMTSKLPGDKQSVESDSKKIRVTMVAWDRSDATVVTAVSDRSLKIWNAGTGQLVRILSGHNDEVYVLEPHPHDEDIILSAGHDGQLLIWDINRGEILFKYLNTIEGQGYGAIFDAKWSPDGCTISASDSHGDILTFGFGSGSPFYQQLPKELFFHTDYRPLVRDQNYWVLDEQTQVPPHLMPPPFLVDIDGNPYPPMLQRLVPGRENCNAEQLVPNIVIGNEGNQEVIQDLPQQILPSPEYEEDDDIRGNAGGSMRSHRIRQSTGDWQTDHNIEWKRNVLMEYLPRAILDRANEIRKLIEEAEKKEYQKQLRTRPLMISTAAPSSGRIKDQRKRISKKQEMKPKNQLTDEMLENYDVMPVCPYLTDESSYSDWAEEVSEPRRTSRTRQKKNAYSRNKSSSDNDEDDDLSEESGASDDADSDNISDQELGNSPRTTRENNKSAKDKSRVSSPRPSTSRQAGMSRASVPRNRLIPKKDPMPKMAQTAKLTATEPSTSGGVTTTSSGPKIKVSEQYKLSEWLSETRPRKSPYYPQINDEIVYFVQGHILYIEAVKQKNVYEPDIKELPWVKGIQLKDHEFCKVVSIRYEIKPPRLCCLKLSLQDENNCPTGRTITLRYHDMPDVLDFFVLKQCYLTALSRDWQAGDRFRCMIDDNWWIGAITCKSPASELYPESVFMCYEIVWTNGEKERMSPWDMEPIDENRVPEDEKEAIPVLANELWSILYKPTSVDWPNCERDTACKAIARGITQVMELAIAEPFLVPVDINVYPTYALIVEYPIDLSTIKARFENNFYRRLPAAEFDIRYLETNAVKFNEQNSTIVKHAKILSALCLRILKSGNNAIDIASVYHQLVDDYYSSTDGNEEEVDIVKPSTSRSVRYLPVRSWKSPDDWKIEAMGLLELMRQTEDSVPFREPVNKHKYPTYHQIITRPMDLETVKEKLQKGAYKEPKDFCCDVRLIFQNSRTFNTNKRSRIYVMTVRLSAMFEEHIKKITSNWRIAKKRHRCRTSSSSEESDCNEPSSEEDQNRSKQNTIKVVVEKIEPIENGTLAAYDSDSDNTPLGALLDRSTESDNTQDKVVSRADEAPYLGAEKRLLLSNGFDPEPSTSSQSIIDDFDHNYTNKQPTTSGTRKDVKSSDFSEDEGLHSDNNDSFGEKMRESGGSDSEEESLNLRQLQMRGKRKSSESDDQDEDFCPDESSSSSAVDAPSRRRRKSSTDSDSDDEKPLKRRGRRPRKPSFVVEEDEEDDSSDNSTSDSNTSDDEVPLRKARRRRKNKKTSSSSQSDSSLRPRRKKRKVLESEDSDLDMGRTNGRARYFGSVSSRGRVRKITERAAAFLKKDKKTG